MKCPNDGTTLQMTERSGVEIDYCPDCRGVWLDRGELDKIIDKSVVPGNVPPPHPAQPTQAHYPAHDYSYHKKHRKESFLGELFDF